jgi:hypothetical protein
MGTSVKSSDINSVFQSIIEQLIAIFKIDVKTKEYVEYKPKEKIEEYKPLMYKEINQKKKQSEFELLLHYISEKHLRVTEKLIILLDSVDQLRRKDLKLDWFFSDLPEKVKIIYSCLKDYKNIFQKLDSHIKNKTENILDLNPIEIDEAKHILWSLMRKAKRKLTQLQERSINKMFDELEDISPLQIKIIFDIISKFKSSYSISNQFLRCKTITDLIKFLFKTIETQKLDNEILFKHCLFYLTLFDFRGISENELEDISSIDDDLLTSIFTRQHPPVRKFPMSLWYRFKYEFKEYLTTKMSEDITVIAW